jgi:PiT family inorganic phosphate transporter
MAYVVPLLLSPLCAFSAAVILYPALSWLRVRMGIVPDHCVCLASAVPEPVFAPSGIAAACRATPVSVKVGNAATCVETYSGHVCGIQAQSVLGVLHFGTAGVVSFARGLNDTPKIAALMLLGCDGAGVWPTLVVGACMALGGMLRGNRVAQTMSRRITEMNHGQGFTASALAGTIVIAASWLGLPVSTTHVMCGALMGIGATNGRAHGGTILGIVGAWLATLPCSMWLGAVCFRAMSSLAP